MRAIVSVNIGGYDTLKPSPSFYGWTPILFTDVDWENKKGWNVRRIETENPKVASRYYKWMTHITLPQYDTICYMDGNMTLKQEPPQCPIWFAHPVRSTVEQEANRIVYLNKAPREEVERQMEYYRSEGFNDGQGLYQNGFFVREHERDINKVCEKVYELTKEYTYRDQLALPFALYKTSYQFGNIRPGTESYRYFNLWGHQ